MVFVIPIEFNNIYIFVMLQSILRVWEEDNLAKGKVGSLSSAPLPSRLRIHQRLGSALSWHMKSLKGTHRTGISVSKLSTIFIVANTSQIELQSNHIMSTNAKLFMDI